jgi:hypothetical protein
MSQLATEIDARTEVLTLAEPGELSDLDLETVRAGKDLGGSFLLKASVARSVDRISSAAAQAVATAPVHYHRHWGGYAVAPVTAF